MTPYHCVTCLDAGCEFCEKVEPWPQETWVDLMDKEIEQLVCDGLDELYRRGKVNARLERMWSL